MVGMKDFYTRDKANEGVKIPLRTPGGAETEHYLVIRSQWSDAFQAAKTEAYRAEFGSISLNQESDVVERHVALTSALVSGWSFDEECTLENVHDFLRNAPQLREMIDRFASNDARFFGKPSSSSMVGRKSK